MIRAYLRPRTHAADTGTREGASVAFENGAKEHTRVAWRELRSLLPLLDTVLHIYHLV